MSAGADFKSRFITIATCQKTVLIPGVGCKADSQLVTEEVVGIDKPIAQILVERTDLVRGDLVIYVFWLGTPEARQGLRERALNYGLTEDEYFNSILKKSSENFRVKVIDKPYLQICLLSSFFGEDTDDILHNGFGKNKKLKVKLSPQPQDILDEITLSGILTSQPSRINSKGLEDFGCTPLLLLSVIDFEKTFGSDNNGKNNCIDASADLSGFFDGLFGGMDSVSEALNTLINEIVKGFMGILNKITSFFSTINAFLLRLLSCLFPLGSISLTADSPAFRDLIDLLLGALDLFEGFFSALSDLLNLLAPLACIKASLADLAGSSLSSIPGLACILGFFTLDLCLNISLDIGGIEAGLAFKALSDALTNLKNLLVTLTSLSIGFPSTFTAVSCLPIESAILMVKLGLRGAIASAGLPL